MTYGVVSETDIEDLVTAIRAEAKRNGFGNAFTFGSTGNYAVVKGVLWTEIAATRNPFFRGEAEDIAPSMWYSSEGNVAPTLGLPE